MGPTPVRHDNAIVFPLSLQNIIQQERVMTVVVILPQIIRTHNTPCMRLLYRSLESRKIYLVKSTFTENHICCMAVYLIIIQAEVFYTGRHAIFLKTFDIRYSQTACKIGVLTHVLKITPIQWGTEYIHARTEHHILFSVKSFLSHGIAIFLSYLGIPCRSQTCQRRESYHRIVAPPCLVPSIPHSFRAYTMRTVRHPVFRNAQTLYTRT